MRAENHSSGQDRVVLAIDQGTSGTKAAVIGGDGVLAVATEPVTVTHGADGAAETDPAALLRSVLDAGARALAAAGRGVDAVALANQGETVLAWDPATGTPLSTAISWQDRRAQSVVDDLVTAHGPSLATELARRTGLVLDPYFSAPKMAWLRRHLTTDGVVTTTDTWLLHELTGAFVTDASTASRSLLLDLDTASWDAGLLELFGLDGERLPEIVAADAVAGSTGAFGAELPVAGLLVDQQAALLGQGCLEPGSAKCTFGTGAFLLADTGTTGVRSGAGLSTSVAWQLRGRTTYCLDGQVFAAGAALQWLVDLGFLPRPGALDETCAADTGGVLCVPAVVGLGAPWWRPSARASITGLGAAAGAGEIVLATVEGIAAQVAAIVDAVRSDTGAPLDVLQVDGGLTASARLLQAVADIAQLQVEVRDMPHATALGVAAAARLALDPSLEIADAVPARGAARVVTPRWSPERAADFRDRWATAASAAPDAR